MNFEELKNYWLQHQWKVLIGVALLVGFWLHAQWAAIIRRRRGLHAKTLGEAAERKARKILERAGYTILETQPIFDAEMIVDNTLRVFQVTPDFLVSRGSQDFVVEVKRTDGDAIAKAANRRQVLEYLYATDLPCLLVNMHRREVQTIDLPPLDELV